MCLGLTCQVESVLADGAALVRGAGRTTRVSLLTVDEPVAPGDWVLVHAGFALARLTEGEVADAQAIRGTTMEEERR